MDGKLSLHKGEEPQKVWTDCFEVSFNKEFHCKQKHREKRSILGRGVPKVILYKLEEHKQ